MVPSWETVTETGTLIDARVPDHPHPVAWIRTDEVSGLLMDIFPSFTIVTGAAGATVAPFGRPSCTTLTVYTPRGSCGDPNLGHGGLGP